MILAKSNRTARRKLVHDIAETGGTAETKSKLRPDTVLQMYERGGLTAAQYEATEEILDIFEALTRPLWCRTMRYSPRVGSPVKRPYIQPIDRMPERLWARYRAAYMPWADIVSHKAVRVVSGYQTTLLAMTISVVVDGDSLAELALRARVAKRTGIRLFGDALRRSLTVYCREGGIG